MKPRISIQVEDFNMLNEAINSNCNTIRFGSEFCMWKIPSFNVLRKAYNLTMNVQKSFKYISPRLSDNALKKVKEHITFLNSMGECEIVINDIGLLNILKQYDNIKPCLGRQLIFILARCPWPELPGWDAGYFEKRRVKSLFYQTSLNFKPSINIYKNYGIYGVDLDFIPECFSHYNFLNEHGLKLSIHLFLAPVAVTRRCHTARFLNEKSPQNCSKPCNTRAFLVKGDIIGVELLIGGNVVFKRSHPSKKHIDKLKKFKEIIISMSPVTEVKNKMKINQVIENLGLLSQKI